MATPPRRSRSSATGGRRRPRRPRHVVGRGRDGRPRGRARPWEATAGTPNLSARRRGLLMAPVCPLGAWAAPGPRLQDQSADDGLRGPRLEALVVDLAVGGPADGVDRRARAWAPCSAARRPFTWAITSASSSVGVGRQLDHGGDGLAELLVGHARRRRRRRSPGGVLSASSTSSGKTFSPPVLMHTDPRPSSVMRAVGLDLGVVAGHRVAVAVDLEERGRRLGLVLVVADGLVRRLTATRPISPEPGLDVACRRRR